MSTRKPSSALDQERALLAEYVGAERCAYGRIQAADGGSGPKYAAKVREVDGRYVLRPLDAGIRKLLHGLRLLVDRRDVHHAELRDGCLVRICGHTGTKGSVVFVRVEHEHHKCA